ncbi:MAG: glycosyltransferase family 4 protein [Acidobacteriota bacterium]
MSTRPSILLTTRPQGVAPHSVPIADFDHRVAREIRALGGRAQLLYTRRLPNPEERAWLDRHDLPWRSWVADRQPSARDFPRLVRLLKELRPTVASFQFSAVSWGLLASRIAGVRHRLAWYQTAYEAILRGQPVAPWRRRLQLAVARGYRRLATHHLAVSRDAAGELERIFRAPASRIHLCHQGIPLPLEGADRKRRPATVVCVAGLGPMKGQATLIDAVARIPRDDVELILVGPGDPEPLRRRALALGIEARCRFTGPLSRERVYEHFETCTVAALPTLADSAPKVALEAMACGAPFAGSAVGGLVDFVEPDVSGILVPAEDAGAWRDVLESLLGDADRRRALGEAGKNRAKHFLLAERGRRLARELWRLATEDRFEGAAAPLPGTG